MASGYGRELWCGDSLRTGRYVTGNLLVMQALYRRLNTPRGTLGDISDDFPDERIYGIDLASYCGATASEFSIAGLPNIVRSELLKDDRVADVAVTLASVQQTDAGWLLSLNIRVVLSDSGDSFAFTLDASSVGVTLLGAV